MILHLVECCIWQQRTGLPLNRRMTTAATWHACKMWHAYACLPDVILSNHAVLEAKRQSMPGCVMPAHRCRGETEITLAPQSHMNTHTHLTLCVSHQHSPCLPSSVCSILYRRFCCTRAVSALLITCLLYQPCKYFSLHFTALQSLPPSGWRIRLICPAIPLTVLHQTMCTETKRATPLLRCHSSHCQAWSPNPAAIHAASAADSVPLHLEQATLG